MARSRSTPRKVGKQALHQRNLAEGTLEQGPTLNQCTGSIEYICLRSVLYHQGTDYFVFWWTVFKASWRVHSDVLGTHTQLKRHLLNKFYCLQNGSVAALGCSKCPVHIRALRPKLQWPRSSRRGFKGIEQLALLALEKTGSHIAAYTSATA